MATTLVTGANRGIGLELCRQLKERGDTVIAVCRKVSAPLKDLGVRIIEGIDVSQADDCARLAKTLKGEPLDILINNAGILERTAWGNLDDKAIASIKRQFEVNSLGPLLVTHALTPLLGSGAKVAIVTSRMGSITDNTSGGHYGYRMSKAAVNIAGVSLAQDLRGKGISVIILHPGFVRTEMTRGQGNIDAAESAQGLLARIEELTPETSGSFRHTNGETLPW